MATFKNPLTVISGSGGGATRPTTWAEFAAMTSTEMQQVYGVGDRVGIACPWVETMGDNTYDLTWEIAAFGTTKKENDSAEYPCVTLVTRLSTPQAMKIDATETAPAVTEETAREGVYYFGYNGSTYTALNLSAGDPIPYGDYTGVYGTDVTDDASIYVLLRQFGWNNYKYSAMRQWLNSDAGANSWWQASHIGDVAPFPQVNQQKGFMSGFEAAFKNVLQRTEVATAGNNTTDDGSVYKTYDYFFIPSRYELCVADSPVEGDRMPYFEVGGSRKFSLLARGTVLGGTTQKWWTRSAARNSSGLYYVSSTGDLTAYYPCYDSYCVVAACKIILAGN